MRVHLRPVTLPAHEGDWIREEVRVHGLGGRHELSPEAERADVILLTDLPTDLGHTASPRRLARLLGLPELWRHLRRTYVLYEWDVPLPYLAGLYSNMAWAPGRERRFASVGFVRIGQELRNRFVADDPPPQDRRWLWSFVGRRSHPVRDRVLSAGLASPSAWVRDTSTYDHFAGGPRPEAPQREYVEIMRASRWAACPRGWSPGSLRLFEAMRLGIAPVVLSDDWYPPEGPDWPTCCVRVPEAEAGRLTEILLGEGDRWRELGARARAAYERFFAPPVAVRHLVDVLEALHHRRPAAAEWWARARWPLDLARLALC
jgi:hypothetical protein